MILKKVLINDKTYYEELSVEDAVKVNENLLVFTEDSEDEFEEYKEMLEEEMEELEDLKEELDDIQERFKDTVKRYSSHGFENINLSKSLNDVFKLFKSFKSYAENNEEESDIVGILPFLSESQLSRIVDEVISGKKHLQQANYLNMMPFLKVDDCDRLFIYYLNTSQTKEYLSSLVPFVSQKCLASVVDEYICGHYQEVNVDELYAFLDKSDIEKLFNYYTEK